MNKDLNNIPTSIINHHVVMTHEHQVHHGKTALSVKPTACWCSNELVQVQGLSPLTPHWAAGCRLQVPRPDQSKYIYTVNKYIYIYMSEKHATDCG